MNERLVHLEQLLQQRFSGLAHIECALNEVTMTVQSVNYLEIAKQIKVLPEFGFEQLMDLCGVDYQSYGDGLWTGQRFAAVSHLLSIQNNWRLRFRVMAEQDDFPVLPSLTGVWSSANWYEIMVLLGIHFGKIFQFPVKLKCAMILSKKESFIKPLRLSLGN